jgi:hypothetical protein
LRRVHAAFLPVVNRTLLDPDELRRFALRQTQVQPFVADVIA